MKLTKEFRPEIESFLNTPLPLWETKLTTRLVQEKYNELIYTGITDRYSYCTSAALNLNEVLPNKNVLFSYNENEIYLEKADVEKLSDFYQENGLIFLNEQALIKANVVSKLKAALNILSLIPECIACISELVNCIQIVASDGPEYDTSYSHPDLPFTIFVSVCEDDSLLGSLRVAESILHEAMHLKLSLIQQYIELVEPNSTDTYFSPWRNIQRPLIGVLHGIFVFRAIQDFFQIIRGNPILDYSEYNFVGHRIADIEVDLQSLKHFSGIRELTKDGASLSVNLLPSN